MSSVYTFIHMLTKLYTLITLQYANTCAIILIFSVTSCVFSSEICSVAAKSDKWNQWEKLMLDKSHITCVLYGYLHLFIYIYSGFKATDFF